MPKSNNKRNAPLDANWRKLVNTGAPTKRHPQSHKRKRPHNKQQDNNQPASEAPPADDKFPTPQPDSRISRFLGVDCEMVGVGPAKRSALARICIVNYSGGVVYDKHVKTIEKVTDYRTKYSGIRPADLKNAESFKVVQQEVADIFKDKIIVGHGLENDLESLLLSHPRSMIRDTAHWKPLRKRDGRGKHRPRKLKDLAKIVLGKIIQTGEHCPAEDALAALEVYKKFSKVWEKYQRSNGKAKVPQLIRDDPPAKKPQDTDKLGTVEFSVESGDIFASKHKQKRARKA